ncbi:hypothetical protein CYMTET_36968 [Cymbomonas tetramitiformis]|uniref:Gamma-glutamylcyclotransferase n=1 Tax=Cymbomonas tetramitiformis TaxID=36881 RepID=A0AAE0F6Q2_9CHLO|nr:hypothetical protein CYMTET_36968 [Cymbomonas tetramitiformis]
MSLVPCACGLGVRHHLRPMDKRRVQSQRQVVWKTCGRQKPKYLSVKQISQVVMMGSKGEDDVWYFAYGANMSPSCLRKRGVHPLEIVAVKCPTLQLTFNHRGAFGNLIPLDDPTEDGPRGENQRARVPCAHGALLRLTTEDLGRLQQFEGGYSLRDCKVQDYDGRTFVAYVFLSNKLLQLEKGLPPTPRYLGLLQVLPRSLHDLTHVAVDFNR